MARVKLGDVAREYKATIKDTADLPIVGLEHLTPGEITLERWEVGTENTFTKGFKKGHMLFGRRRAYLKKAALAPLMEFAPEILPSLKQSLARSIRNCCRLSFKTTFCLIMQ